MFDRVLLRAGECWTCRQRTDGAAGYDPAGRSGGHLLLSTSQVHDAAEDLFDGLGALEEPTTPAPQLSDGRSGGGSRSTSWTLLEGQSTLLNQLTTLPEDVFDSG